jgi:hypothetical protein
MKRQFEQDFYLFKLLIESVKALRTLGISRQHPKFSDALGIEFGLSVLENLPDQDSVYRSFNILLIYCSPAARTRFSNEVLNVGFDIPLTSDPRAPHPGTMLVPTIEVSDLAIYFRAKGYDAEHCPFDGPAKRIWDSIFNQDSGSDIELHQREIDELTAIHSCQTPFHGNLEELEVLREKYKDVFQKLHCLGGD